MGRYLIEKTNNGYMIYDQQEEDNVYDEEGNNMWDTMDEVNEVLKNKKNNMSKLDFVIANIDYKLLQQQKLTLCNINPGDNCLSEEQCQHIDGLIGLIDNIQDAIVEDGIESEALVFNIPNKN